MKSNCFTMLMMAASMLFLACGNNQKNNGKATESDNTEEVMTENQEEEAEEAAAPDDPTGIVGIRKAWAGKTIKVDGGSAVIIGQFAKAFCQTYPQCDTNKAMLDYLTAPDKFNGDWYQVSDNSNNGHMSCMMMVETAQQTEMCYWNRKNGHKLFAAYMESTHESMAYDEHLVVFYDYDPETGVMTPETALTDMIEKRVKGFGSFMVTLPSEGKDIDVYAYTIDLENDSAEREEMKLVWNGMTFDWENEE